MPISGASAEPGQQRLGHCASAVTAPPATAPAASDASRQVQTVSYDFHTHKWAEAYGKGIDEMIAALKTNGAPVLWIGLPAIRSTRTIGDISYLNDLYRKRAEKARVTYVDIWGACRCRTIVGAQKLAVLEGIVIECHDRAYGRAPAPSFGSSEPGTATGMPRFSARRTSCSYSVRASPRRRPSGSLSLINIVLVQDGR
jgi:hypothetical protein